MAAHWAHFFIINNTFLQGRSSECLEYGFENCQSEFCANPLVFLLQYGHQFARQLWKDYGSSKIRTASQKDF
jgi:hypothetical protein